MTEADRQKVHGAVASFKIRGGVSLSIWDQGGKYVMLEHSREDRRSFSVCLASRSTWNDLYGCFEWEGDGPGLFVSDAAGSWARLLGVPRGFMRELSRLTTLETVERNRADAK